VEPDVIPQQTLAQIERTGSADLMVGILAPGNNGEPSAVAMVREAIAGLSALPRAVIVKNGASRNPDAIQDDAQDGSVPVIVSELYRQEPAEVPLESMFEAYRILLAVGGKLGARACAIIASNLQTVTPQWIYRLAEPALERNFDLVTPLYARNKFEGLLNRSMIAPLHRALYGKRIENPNGPDLGVSGRLIQEIVRQPSGTRFANDNITPLASITPAAIRGGYQICQMHVGARVQPSGDLTNLSSLLAQVLGPIFSDVERNAAFWQKTRGSQSVPGFGEPGAVSDETGTVDVRRLIDAFQLGTQNLQEVWGVVLPPASLFELRKLARLAPERFRMPDELWVRIVYDFVLGYRLRTISRDHLLRSMTPLYLGWIASYALELDGAGLAQVESRLERLSIAYEAQKPYLMSRWRWPDRFNP